MKAGRELDALVAKHVMHDAPGQVWYLAYSTDIAAAWTVVEKMRMGPNFEVEINAWLPEDGWTVQFGTAETVHDVECLPRAICLAALKAVGAEVPV